MDSAREVPALGRHWWRAVRGRSRHPQIALSLGFLLALLISAYAVPLPFDPRAPDAGAVLQAPSATHWFGTDRLGSDVFARTIASARLDLPIAMLGTLISMVVGVTIGLVASSKGRASERIMRGVDMFQAFPLLVLAIVIVALTGNNLRNVIVALAIINIPLFIRLVRSEALALRETRFVEAAVSIGASRARVLGRHILPNVSATILAQTSLAMAQAIVVIAALSFLGIGITPPTPSWGAMIQSGAQNMTTGEWWVVLFPGLAVFLVVFAFNEIGDGIGKRFGRGGR